MFKRTRAFCDDLAEQVDRAMVPAGPSKSQDLGECGRFRVRWERLDSPANVGALRFLRRDDRLKFSIMIDHESQLRHLESMLRFRSVSPEPGQKGLGVFGYLLLTLRGRRVLSYGIIGEQAETRRGFGRLDVTSSVRLVVARVSGWIRPSTILMAITKIKSTPVPGTLSSPGGSNGGFNMLRLTEDEASELPSLLQKIAI